MFSSLVPKLLEVIRSIISVDQVLFLILLWIFNERILTK